MNDGKEEDLHLLHPLTQMGCNSFMNGTVLSLIRQDMIGMSSLVFRREFLLNCIMELDLS